MAETIHLVRHGKADGPHRTLGEKGLEDAARASNELVAKGLGGNALVLSSDLRRAMQTAEVIAAGLDTQVFPSVRIAKGGNDADGIENLDDFIDKAVQESSIESADGKHLVVVTHAPVLAVVKDVDMSDIGFGEVLQYTPGTWNNRDFSSAEAYLLESMITKAMNS